MSFLHMGMCMHIIPPPPSSSPPSSIPLPPASSKHVCSDMLQHRYKNIIHVQAVALDLSPSAFTDCCPTWLQVLLPHQVGLSTAVSAQCRCPLNVLQGSSHMKHTLDHKLLSNSMAALLRLSHMRDAAWFVCRR